MYPNNKHARIHKYIPRCIPMPLKMKDIIQITWDKERMARHINTNEKAPQENEHGKWEC